jgi:ABC-type oligopeptide transport system substrate-binding subunit
LKEANGIVAPGLRMNKLAQCESRLLEVMPAIPVTFSRNLYLAKPYLRAFKTVLGNATFRYAWIDHNFKESNHP